MTIAATKTRLSKLDPENLAMKIRVWQKQYPSDKISFRGYGEHGESRIKVITN